MLGISAADGVSADLQGVQQLTVAARDRATDVRAIVTALHALPVGEENSFGGASAAYRELLEAWTDELGINAAALDELGDKFTRVAARFQQRDLHWSTSLQQAVTPTTADELANPGSSPGPSQPGVAPASTPTMPSTGGCAR